MKNLKIYVIGKKEIFKFGMFALLLIVALALSKSYVVSVFHTVAKNEQTSKKLPIYCVDTQDKKLSISFDAAWGADDTDDLLAILKKHNVKATFFLVGDWVRKYPEEVKRIAADGHDIGSHSNKHPHMASMSKQECKKELESCHEEVKKLTGKDMMLFRPPFGEYNNTVIEAAHESGYYPIQWDVDSLDWKEYGVEPLVDKVLKHKHLGNGTIVLFHNNAKYTKDALDTIITGLEEKGFEIVPISQLIIKEEYYMDHEGRQHRLKDSKSN